MTLRPAFRRQGRRRNFPNRTNFSSGRREKNLRWKLKFLLFLALASALAARKGEESSFKAENSPFPGSGSSLGRPEGRRIFFESRNFSFSRFWLQPWPPGREKNLLKSQKFLLFPVLAPDVSSRKGEEFSKTAKIPLFSVCLLLWSSKSSRRNLHLGQIPPMAASSQSSKLKIKSQELAYRANAAHKAKIRFTKMAPYGRYLCESAA